MKRFHCRVASPDGNASTEFHDAESVESLSRALSAKGRYLLEAREEGPRADGMARRGGRRRIARKTLAEFTSLMAIMLEAGMSLRDSLELVSGEGGVSKVKGLAAELLEKVEKGGSYSQALTDLGEGLPPVYSGLVRIGERIGNLDKVYRRLADYLDEERKLHDRVSNAMAYPIIVLCVAVFGSVGVLTFVLPKLSEVFSVMGGSAAGQIEGNLNIVRWAMGAFLGLAAVAGIAFPIVMARKRSDPRFALAIDSLLLRVPIAGGMTRNKESLDFAYAMETLTASGVTVDDALGEAYLVARNGAFKDAIQKAHEAVRKGERLSTACSRSSAFPPTVARWIEVGERVGQVEKVFEQIRVYFQRQAERSSARIMNLIEPAISVLVGGIVLLIISLFILPIYQAYGSLL